MSTRSNKLDPQYGLIFYILKLRSLVYLIWGRGNNSVLLACVEVIAKETLVLMYCG